MTRNNHEIELYMNVSAIHQQAAFIETASKP
jgi:hypothetical protein